jgi:hypothetical protein
MQRTEYRFDQFHKHFIRHADAGYMPVSISLRCVEGEWKKVVTMDMICEWWPADGNVIFVDVVFDTQEEYQQILDYVAKCADILRDRILYTVNRLSKVKF